MRQEEPDASEKHLRTVIEQSPLSIHVFTPDGHSLLANGSWDKLWYLGEVRVAASIRPSPVASSPTLSATGGVFMRAIQTLSLLPQDLEPAALL